MNSDDDYASDEDLDVQKLSKESQAYYEKVTQIDCHGDKCRYSGKTHAHDGYSKHCYACHGDVEKSYAEITRVAILVPIKSIHQVKKIKELVSSVCEYHDPYGICNCIQK